MLAAIATLPLAAWADWPDRTITMAVPTAAGGTTDIAAHTLAQKMSQDLGVSVVVDNKAGGGRIGTANVARAKPDGYTLLMGTIGPVGLNFSLYQNLPYKATDLRGITNVISVPNILVVNATTPEKTTEELIRLAMLAGEVDYMIDNLPSSIPHTKSGKFGALAITSKERSAQLPNVPTMAEVGLPMQVTAWFGLLAPAGTPDNIVQKLQLSANPPCRLGTCSSALPSSAVYPAERPPQNTTPSLPRSAGAGRRSSRPPTFRWNKRLFKALRPTPADQVRPCFRYAKPTPSR